MSHVNPDKLSKLAGLAFENGIRLHLDAIKLFSNGASYPSALQLSILAQEELGKAFLLEETVFRTYSKEWSEEFQRDTVIEVLSRHQIKQSWFYNFTGSFTTRNHIELLRLYKGLNTGKPEELKQSATYVGLTTKMVGKRKTLNLAGKIKHPWQVKPADVEKQITMVNDLLLVYSTGFIRGIYGTDIYGIASNMTQELIDELRTQWGKSSKSTQKTLKELEEKPVLKDALSDWADD